MRLIDADKFSEWLEPGLLRSDTEKCFSEADLVGIIMAQPTAYDVDKVVEKLTEPLDTLKACVQEYCGICDCDVPCYGLKALDEIIDIVKEGGK